MNYRGSSKRLLSNSKAAMLSSIEIYNKPSFEYRNECFVILLLNAWELLLKAILSRNGQSIFYKKERNRPYKTYSLTFALVKAKELKLFPRHISINALEENISLLTTYRDNSVHFYNEPDFGIALYSLAQASILNYRDVVVSVFSEDICDEVNWTLIPLAFRSSIEPIDFIAKAGSETKSSPAVRQFLTLIQDAVTRMESNRDDTGRLLIVSRVKLESTKKISKADFIVGVQAESPSTGQGPLVVRNADPNIDKPLRQKDFLAKISELHGIRFTQHTFHAIVHAYKVKENPHLFWCSKDGVSLQYSEEVMTFIKKLTKKEVEEALSKYKEKLRKARK